jgi:hypothetical protein
VDQFDDVPRRPLRRDVGGQAEPRDPDPRDLQDFVLQAGRALNDSGSPVSEIQKRLTRIAAAYGATGARVVVMPTSVIVSLGPAQAATIERAPPLGGSLRLDQIAALYELLRQAEQGLVRLDVGIRRLAEIRELSRRFGVLVTAFGYVAAAVGICLGPGTAGGRSGHRRGAGCDRRGDQDACARPFVAAGAAARRGGAGGFRRRPSSRRSRGGWVDGTLRP